MKILDIGPAETRAAIVIQALEAGYTLRTGSNGTFLSQDDHVVAVPRDVMELLISEGVIEVVYDH